MVSSLKSRLTTFAAFTALSFLAVSCGKGSSSTEGEASAVKAAFDEYTIDVKDSEKVEFCATQKSFCLKNAVSLTFLSVSAYVKAEASVDILEEKGFDKSRIKHFKDDYTDMEALWVERESDLVGVIAFRGTESNSDITQDARFIKSHLTLEGSDWGYVHSGFKSSFDGLHKQIAEHIKSRIQHYKSLGQELKVWGTGHSLGGAVSTLFHAKMMEMGIENFQGSYTIGSPRVGGTDFAAKFNSKMKETNMPYFRMRYKKDMVTMVPPHIRPLRYRHVGILGYIHSEDGELYTEPTEINNIGYLDSNFQGTNPYDHAQSRYYAALRARLDRTNEQCKNDKEIVDKIYEE